ncbi:MAG: outer membrane protein assembly factor BamA [Pseudomonadota bacterium]
MKKTLLLIFLALSILSTAYAQNSFLIRRIDIRGLHGITTSTVLNYMPVSVGSHMNDKASARTIEALYKTGFFENVRLSRSQNTLIVTVVQRPIISRITISGNKKIKTDQLKKTLQSVNFSEGQIFNPVVLNQIQTALAHQYFVIGLYNARVNVSISHKAQKEVGIHITISEGKPAKIHQINIIGSYSFKEKTLLKQFQLQKTHLFSFYSHDDIYSSEKLSADLETLRSYYLDRGFLKFQIHSAQVSISPDRKQVYLSIQINEGPQYKVSGYTFSGKFPIAQSELQKMVQLQPGKFFSRKELIDGNKAMTDALGAKGYAYANINAEPKIDERAKTISFNFFVQPGPRIYVRRVHFNGNYRTNDEVFRRALMQKEGGLISTTNVKDSKRNLLMLPFVRTVDVSTKPVPGKPNQVDLLYKVEEQPSAQLRAGLGYSVLDKFVINASANQKNVLGTGNSMGLDFSTSAISTSVNFSYYNPYYTKSGIGRSINVFATHFDSSKANIADYATNEFGGSLGFSYPITENNYLNYGVGYSNSYLSIGSSPSKELSDFVNKYRRHFYQPYLTSGWSYQGFDRSIFPTKGFNSSLGATVTVPTSKHSLEYYKISFSSVYYHPIYQSFIGKARLDMGVGDGFGKYKKLPFFKNFYAGGTGSVRGYEGNTLGPKDSNGDPIGGDFEVDGSLGLVFPNPFGNNLRTTWFVDAGNVYDHLALNLRTSTGLELDWLSPLGMLNFSVATPINKHHGDNSEFFQFNIGTSF